MVFVRCSPVSFRAFARFGALSPLVSSRLWVSLRLAGELAG